MIEIQELANLKLSLLGSIFLTLIGMLVYNIAELMATKKMKSIKEFVFGIWWYDNSLKFIGSGLIIFCLFWLSYSRGVLTADKSLLLGLVGNFIFAKFISWIQKNNAA